MRIRIPRPPFATWARANFVARHPACGRCGGTLAIEQESTPGRAGCIDIAASCNSCGHGTALSTYDPHAYTKLGKTLKEAWVRAHFVCVPPYERLDVWRVVCRYISQACGQITLEEALWKAFDSGAIEAVTTAYPLEVVP